LNSIVEPRYTGVFTKPNCSSEVLRPLCVRMVSGDAASGVFPSIGGHVEILLKMQSLVVGEQKTVRCCPISAIELDATVNCRFDASSITPALQGGGAAGTRCQPGVPAKQGQETRQQQ
jgi:hypothetical protein